ncbi:MAG: hypothetical protein EBS56_04725 [Planctomycetia bacterium]|nr:hypothetical protein [Planctomycetia bacterium]
MRLVTMTWADRESLGMYFTSTCPAAWAANKSSAATDSPGDALGAACTGSRAATGVTAAHTAERAKMAAMRRRIGMTRKSFGGRDRLP